MADQKVSNAVENELGLDKLTLGTTINPRQDNLGKPRILILVGLPGSGKSTFTRRLTEQNTPRPWCQINQDLLGTRFDCLNEAKQCLWEGKNVVIDRCNFDQRQRATWIELGHMLNAHVGCILFAIPMAKCIKRVNGRESHPTLESGPQAEGVVRRMASEFCAPDPSEGIDFLRIVTENNDVDALVKSIA